MLAGTVTEVTVAASANHEIHALGGGQNQIPPVLVPSTYGAMLKSLLSHTMNPGAVFASKRKTTKLCALSKVMPTRKMLLKVMHTEVNLHLDFRKPLWMQQAVSSTGKKQKLHGHVSSRTNGRPLKLFADENRFATIVVCEDCTCWHTRMAQ